MTEKKREELIEQMANGMFASKQYNGCFALMDMARAALAVAEPVIREQVEIALHEENARLREALSEIAEEKPMADGLELRPEWLQSIARAAMGESDG